MRAIRRWAEDADLASLARWVVDVGSAPEHQCAHTWAGEDASEVEANLRDKMEDGELRFLLAERDTTLIGAFGAEFDRELRRAWLWGPHVAPTEPFPETASALLGDLVAGLPPELIKFDAYLNVANERGRVFFLGAGFHEAIRAHEYRFQGAPPRDVEPAGRDLAEGERESFFALLTETFPEAYYTGERLLKMVGDTHRLLIEGDGTHVHAFSALAIDPGGASGEVQMMGVAPSHQGRGLGRRMLVGSLVQLIDRDGVDLVCLNVVQTNDRARTLYESVGFRREFTGVAYRKER